MECLAVTFSFNNFRPSERSKFHLETRNIFKFNCLVIRVPPVSNTLKQLEGKEYSSIYSCFLIMKVKIQENICTSVRIKQFQTGQEWWPVIKEKFFVFLCGKEANKLSGRNRGKGGYNVREFGQATSADYMSRLTLRGYRTDSSPRPPPSSATTLHYGLTLHSVSRTLLSNGF